MNEQLGKPIDPGTLFAALLKWLPKRRVESPPQHAQTRLRQEDGCDFLRRIPGLDVTAGLKYLGGRQPLYLRLLRKFAQERGADVERMRKNVAAGDLEGAQRLAHTLKGVSGTLGAQQIRTLSERIEDGLKEASGSHEANLMCDELADDLATLSAAILDQLPGD